MMLSKSSLIVEIARHYSMGNTLVMIFIHPGPIADMVKAEIDNLSPYIKNLIVLNVDEVADPYRAFIYENDCERANLWLGSNQHG